MDVWFSDGAWRVEKEPTGLDLFVKEFLGVLRKHGFGYAVVSGYVAILLGRSRHSEDVDLFLDRMAFGKFSGFWDDLQRGFECINTPDPKEAYHDYLLNGTALRFSRKGEPIPNMEVKFARNELEQWSLKNSRPCFLNGEEIRIAPLELQIPFKLYLGSEKDIEDARHLWLLCKEHLNNAALSLFVEKLGQRKNAEKWLK